MEVEDRHESVLHGSTLRVQQCHGIQDACCDRGVDRSICHSRSNLGVHVAAHVVPNVGYTYPGSYHEIDGVHEHCQGTLGEQDVERSWQGCI